MATEDTQGEEQTGNGQQKTSRRILGWLMSREAKKFFLILGLFLGVAFLVGLTPENGKGPLITGRGRWVVAAYVLFLGAALIYYSPRLIWSTSESKAIGEESNPILDTHRYLSASHGVSRPSSGNRCI